MGKLTPQDTIKDCNLAIGPGLGLMKLLKNVAGKSLYFMQLFLHLPFFVKILLAKLRFLYIQYA